MKVIVGDEVKWMSRANYERWLKGKVVRILRDADRGDVAVVKDRTGLTPRCIEMVRLQPVVERRQRFAGSLA